MLCRGYHFVEGPGIAAKLDAAVLRIRAGDIQLVSGNAFALVENLNSVFVVFTRVYEDVGDHKNIFDFAQLGKLLVNKSAGANVLQSDGIQHSGCGLVEARRGIADHGLTRETFDHEPAELVQMHNVFELDAVSK